MSIFLLDRTVQIMSWAATDLQTHRSVCFAMRLNKGDFIAADAIAKLRQKNPNTIRSPEEDLGGEEAAFDYIINPAKAHLISRCGSPFYSQRNDLFCNTSTKTFTLNHRQY